MANRIPPPNPEETRLSQAKKLEEAQKIQQVTAVDPDEQARKQQLFQQMMASDEEEAEEIEKELAPSPFQTSFYQSQNNAPPDLNLEQLPSPAYSPAPDLIELPAGSEDFLSDQDLPQSNDFYSQVPLPGQPLEETQRLIPKETSAQSGQQGESEKQPAQKETQKRAAQKEGAKPAGAKEKVLEPSPFGVPGKPAMKKETAKEPPPFVKKKTPEEEAPSAKYWVQPQFESGGTPAQSEKSKEMGASKGRSAPSQKPQGTPETAPKEFSPFLLAQEKKEGESSGGQGKSQKGPVEIVAPSLPGLPSSFQPAAASAATSAAPYLRGEVLPLFYQMVGTILVMTNQGISTTEILLNNPAFADSKFFGASIEIIKYSTAPDSLNIRLSGSNEAVAAFNQNIPGLMAAFQTGGFRFRIGRIDAVYSTDKPIFRRKEEKSQDFNSDTGNEDR